MLSESKKFLEEHDYKPRISFKDGLAHTVVVKSEESLTINTADGEKQGIKYTVEEDGEEREFFTSAVSLIGRLAQVNKGDKIIIQMLKTKEGADYKSTFSVKKVNAGSAKQQDGVLNGDDYDNIPIIEE